MAWVVKRAKLNFKKVLFWDTLVSSDQRYLVIKVRDVEIVKEVTRSDGLSVQKLGCCHGNLERFGKASFWVDSRKDRSFKTVGLPRCRTTTQ